MFDAVTCAIPGAKRPDQVEQNIRASSLPRLSRAIMLKAEAIYNKYIRSEVHHRW
jgi:aryl-alcohol dehydrogenase-like predicted oxidoreductase